jgi:hypothetical protein
MHNSPLLFNAPGVSLAVRESPYADFIRAAIDLSEYVNARDASGAAVLRTISPNSKIFVTPDTALDITKVWSSAELTDAYRGAFLSRGKSVPKRTLAVHVRKTTLPAKVGSVSRHLDQIATHTGTVPIILSFGKCHSDDEAAREVGIRMRCERLVLDRPSSLREITACLAQSVGYLGSSFHGCLVSSAFRRPSQLVVRQPQPKHKEASDLLLFSTPPVHSWLDVDPQAFSARLVDGKAGIQPDAFERLDQHWGLVQDILSKGGQTDKQQKMRAFCARQRGVDLQSELSLDDYVSLIEPLKQANLVGLIRRYAHQRLRIDEMEAAPRPKKSKNWIRRISCALRVYR